MEQIEAAVGEHHGLSLGLPASPQFQEFVTSVQTAHGLQCIKPGAFRACLTDLGKVRHR
jgi:hypothetical protein